MDQHQQHVEAKQGLELCGGHVIEVPQDQTPDKTTLGNNHGILLDIYIFACRTKGRAVKLVQREFSYILWERKWNISEENSASGYIDAFREEANSLQAEAIIKTIDNI